MDLTDYFGRHEQSQKTKEEISQDKRSHLFKSSKIDQRPLINHEISRLNYPIAEQILYYLVLLFSTFGN